MDTFNSRFYRINAKLLTSIGQWPYQEPKIQRIQQVICHLAIITVIISQCIKMFEIWGNVDIMIEIATPVGVQIKAVINSLNCIINRNKMTRLLDIIRMDWSRLRKSEEIEILKKYAEQGRNLTIYYTVFMFSSMTTYLILPLMPRILNVLMPRNESRAPTYLYHTQYYVDPEEYFLPIFMHTYTGTIITVTTIIAVDVMYATYVHHVCGMFAVIGHRLENLSKNAHIDVDINPSKDKDRCYHGLAECIHAHNGAIEFAILIESTYSTAYLFQIGISMVLMSITGVQLLIKFGQYDEMYRLGQFLFAQMSYLIFNSWPGQKLIDQGTRFRDSVYRCEWYFFSLRARQLLKIVMIRALTPQKITAGSLYEMTMENCGSVLKTSVSYFTVFASLR